MCLLCLYEAAAPAEIGMTSSFSSRLYLEHWSQAMNQGKDTLPKSKESVYVTHEHQISLRSNPRSTGKDKKPVQPKLAPKDQEMSWLDLLSPVDPLRQLLNIVGGNSQGQGLIHFFPMYTGISWVEYNSIMLLVLTESTEHQLPGGTVHWVIYSALSITLEKCSTFFLISCKAVGLYVCMCCSQ